MSKKTLYVLGMLLTIIITCFLQWKYCCNCDSPCKKEDTTNNVVVTPEVKEATKLPFVVKDSDGNLSLKVDDNFNFKKSKFNFLTPVSANVDTNIDKLKEYLTTNEGKALAITGYYKSDEENNSMYPNLGYARANTVKNYLVSKGIPSKFINTFGELKDDMYPDAESVFYGPVNFGVAKGEDNSEAIAKLLADIKANPLALYFKKGESRINLTQEQRRKMMDISRYLDKVDDARCLIIGHTDNTGDAANNMVLGQKRADFAKEQLVRNAISSNKIDAISKGQTEPIADNATEEGKAKNRRTVITLK